VAVILTCFKILKITVECLLLILKFFGSLILFFAFGKLIGHIFKLEEYLKYTSANHPKKQV